MIEKIISYKQFTVTQNYFAYLFSYTDRETRTLGLIFSSFYMHHSKYLTKDLILAGGIETDIGMAFHNLHDGIETNSSLLPFRTGSKGENLRNIDTLFFDGVFNDKGLLCSIF